MSKKAASAAARIAKGERADLEKIERLEKEKEEKAVRAQWKRLKGYTLTEKRFNVMTRAALISVVLESGHMQHRNDPRLLKLATAERVAEYIIAARVNQTHLHSTVTLKILKEAKKIAAGNDDAGRIATAEYIAYIKLSVKEFEHQIEHRGLADKRINNEVRNALAIALQQEQGGDLWRDVDVYCMNAQAVAKLVVEAKPNGNPVDAEAVAALRLANGIAKGDSAAARELIGTSRAMFDIRVKNLLHRFERLPHNRQQLHALAKSALLVPLLDFGLVGRPQPDLRGMQKWSAARLARLIVQKRLHRGDTHSHVAYYAVYFARQIAARKKKALKVLAAVYQSEFVNRIHRAVIDLRTRNLKQAAFNQEVKNVLINTLLRARAIKSKDDASISDYSAQQLAAFLMQAKIRSKVDNDPVSWSAVRLAPAIAKGNSDAARELVAQDTIVFTEKRTQLFRQMHSQTLATPSLAEKVKAAELSFLVHERVITGTVIMGSSVDKMTAFGVAKLIVAKVKGHPTGRPEAAVRQAKRILQKDQCVARLMAATYEAEIQKKVLVYALQHSLKEHVFNDRVRSLIGRALLEGGIIQSLFDPRLRCTDAQGAALLLIESVGNKALTPLSTLTSIHARAIAAGSTAAASRLMSGYLALIDESSQMEKKALKKLTLANKQFNSEVRAALIAALIEAGTVSSMTDAKVRGLQTAQSVAKLLLVSALKADNMRSQATVQAVRLSQRIASGRNSAARSLVAVYVATLKLDMQSWKVSLKGKTLKNERFNKYVKGYLSNALIAFGVIRTPEDALVLCRSAQEVARVVSTAKVRDSDEHPTETRIAFRLATAIAQNDNNAAIELVATSRMVLDCLVTGVLARRTSANAISVEAKAAMKATLLDSGASPGAVAHAFRSSSSQDAAAYLTSKKLNSDTASFGIMHTALVSSKAIARGEKCPAKVTAAVYAASIRQYVGEFSSGLVSQSLSSANFNKRVKATLSSILKRAGARVKSSSSETAQTLAFKMLSNKAVKNVSTTDSLVADVMRYAAPVASGDDAAARELVAHNMAFFSDRLDYGLHRMRNLTFNSMKKPVWNAIVATLAKFRRISQSEMSLDVLQLAQKLAVASASRKAPLADDSLELIADLAKPIADKSACAARVVVATHVGVKKSKRVSNTLIRSLIVKVLVEKEVVESEFDGKVLGKSSCELAQLLVASKKVAETERDVVSKAVIVRAKALAKCDKKSSKRQQAEQEVAKIYLSTFKKEVKKAKREIVDENNALAKESCAQRALASAIRQTSKKSVARKRMERLPVKVLAKEIRANKIMVKSVAGRVVKLAVRLAAHLAKGSSAAMEKLAEVCLAVKRESRNEYYQQVRFETIDVEENTVRSKSFHCDLRRLLTTALMEGRVVLSRTDPHVLDKSLRELAGMVGSKAELSDLKSALARKAKKMSVGIAAGSDHAARVLVAFARSRFARHVKLALDGRKRRGLNDNAMMSEAKAAYIHSLIVALPMHFQDIAAVQKLTLVQLARTLKSKHLSTEALSDRVTGYAARLAGKISNNDLAAIRIVSAVYQTSIRTEMKAEIAILGRVTLKNLSFNRKTQEILIRALESARLIQGNIDSTVLGKTAQEIAADLAANKKLSEVSDDPEVIMASVLARSIASGDSGAARELAAFSDMQFDCRVAIVMRHMKNRGEDSPLVKPLLVSALQSSMLELIQRYMRNHAAHMKLIAVKGGKSKVTKMAHMLSRARVPQSADKITRLSVELGKRIAHGDLRSMHLLAAVYSVHVQRAVRALASGLEKTDLGLPEYKAMLRTGLVTVLKHAKQTLRPSQIASLSTEELAAKVRTARTVKAGDVCIAIGKKFARSIEVGDRPGTIQFLAWAQAQTLSLVNIRRRTLAHATLNSTRFRADLAHALRGVLAQTGSQVKLASGGSVKTINKALKLVVARKLKRTAMTTLVTGTAADLARRMLSGDVVALRAFVATYQVEVLLTEGPKTPKKHKTPKCMFKKKSVLNKAVMRQAKVLYSENVQLSSSAFNEELKHVLLKALLELKLIQDLNDPSILGKNAQQCAGIIAKNKKFLKRQVSSEISASALCLAPSIARGDNKAAYMLYGTYLERFEYRAKLSSKIFAATDLLSPMLQQSVKAALKVALLRGGKIQGKRGVLVDVEKQNLVSHWSIKQLVNMLNTLSHDQRSAMFSPVAAAALRLAPKLANNNVVAFRVLATVFDVELMEAVETAETFRSIKGKTLVDKRFNAFVRTILAETLVLTRTVQSMSAPQVRGLSAQQVAKILASTEKKTQQYKHGMVVAASIRLARKIASGNNDAARHLAALQMVSFQEQVMYTERGMQDHGTDVFTAESHQLRSALMVPLVESRATNTLARAKKSKSPRDVAKLVDAALVPIGSVHTTVAIEALRVAKGVQKGNKPYAMRLVAMFKVMRREQRKLKMANMGPGKGSSLHDLIFAKRVKAILIKAAMQAAVVPDQNDLRVVDASVEAVAKVLKTAVIDPRRLGSPLVGAALSVADEIAKSNSSAARRLDRAYAAMVYQDVRPIKKELKSLTLQSSALASQVRAALVSALVSSAVVPSATDPRVAQASAVECAVLLAKAKVNPKAMASQTMEDTVRLASRIAAGDNKAARDLAARYQLSIRSAVSDEQADLDKMSLSNGVFNHRVASVLQRSLVVAGCASDWNVAAVGKKNAQDFAKAVVLCKPVSKAFDDSVFELSHVLARAIANDDDKEARRLLAAYNTKLASEVSVQYRRFTASGNAEKVALAALHGIYMTFAAHTESRASWNAQTVRQAAKRIRVLKTGVLKNEVQERIFGMLKPVLKGSKPAMRMIAALYSAEVLDTTHTFEQQLAGQTLKQPVFDRQVKAALVGVLQDMNVIKHRYSMAVLGKSAKHVARIIAMKSAKKSCNGGQLCTVAKSFAPAIAHGNSQAARQILAIDRANFQNKVKARLYKLRKERFSLVPKLREEARRCMIAALVEAGSLGGENDPKVASKTTRGVGMLLAKVAPEKLLDANTFAQRAREVSLVLVKHFDSAGKLLAAMHAVYLEDRIDDIRRTLGHRSLQEPKFNAHIKRILVKCLILSGIVSRASNHIVNGKSAQAVAKVLLRAGKRIRTGDSRSRSIRSALQSARGIAESDDKAAMRLFAYTEVVREIRLLSRIRSYRRRYTWGVPAFDQGVKDALVFSLRTIKVVKRKTNPLVHGKSAQEIANIFQMNRIRLLAKMFPRRPVIKTAMRTAAGIAKGDASAARLLLAVYQTAFGGRRAAGGAFPTASVGRCTGILPLAQYFTNKTGEHSKIYLKEPKNVVRSTMWCRKMCKHNPKCMAYTTFNGCAGPQGNSGPQCGSYTCTLSRVPAKGLKLDVHSRCATWVPRPRGKFVQSKGGCLGAKTLKRFWALSNGSHSSEWFSNPKNPKQADTWCQEKCRSEPQCRQWTTWNGCKGAGGKKNPQCGTWRCTLSSTISKKILPDKNMACGQYHAATSRSLKLRSKMASVQKTGKCGGLFSGAAFTMKKVQAVKDCKNLCAVDKQCNAYMATAPADGFGQGSCVLSRRRPESWKVKSGACSANFNKAVYMTFQQSEGQPKMPKDPSVLASWCQNKCVGSARCRAFSTFTECKAGSAECDDAYCFLSSKPPSKVKSSSTMKCAWLEEDIQPSKSSQCGYWPKYVLRKH